MTKIVIAGVMLISIGGGLLLYFNGRTDLGIGAVIIGYVIYIVTRLYSKRMRASKTPAEEPKQESVENHPDPDSWEELRSKAIEALNRKLRGQKIVVDSFFRPAHAKFPALVKTHEDLSSTGTTDLALKTDFEILRLGRDSTETQDILDKVSGSVHSEEELDLEIKRLRS